MTHEILFTCRVPQKHRVVFENYSMIEIMGCGGNGVIRTRDATAANGMMTVAFRLKGEDIPALERTRSRISGRAIELNRPKA